jgi:C1A family cysteine protease
VIGRVPNQDGSQRRAIRIGTNRMTGPKHKHELRIRKIKRYGWRPDPPDQRDHLYAAPMQTLAALPSSVDLRAKCPPVYDQGDLGSCTGNAIAAAVQFDREKQGLQPDFVPSRLFIYYNERVIEGTVDTDAGANIRDGIKVVAKLGAPPEPEWPYDIHAFAEQPPNEVFADALKDTVVSYSRVPQSLTQMRGCLAAGFPIVFGFTVYDRFEGPQVRRTGIVPLPNPQSESVVGGHAVMAVGYDDSEQRFIVRNSWGASWGMQGYFTMPYAYLTDRGLASDFWTLRTVASS